MRGASELTILLKSMSWRNACLNRLNVQESMWMESEDRARNHALDPRVLN
jgi:hypothetical protein